MDAVDRVVIVGGGLAAATAAEVLRDGGYGGRIVLAGAEHHLPYERPPLSKGYLAGDVGFEKALVHPAEWYVENDIDLRLGVPVTSIDPGRRTVTTPEAALGYDRLLVATGASPRRLPAGLVRDAPVAYLRTVEDSDRIRAGLRPDTQVVIVGGGWIGLEVAAAARSAGCDVVVVEALELPLVRVLGKEVAEVFASLHRAHGVDVRTQSAVASFRARGERVVVTLDDASSVEADLVVVGVGVTPETALAEAAGLETRNGIVVDQRLRTPSHPDVFAAGDVANAYHPLLGRHVRVEHWDNAAEQGRAAARNMLGADADYDRLPYFFTDQYDLGMEYVGHVGPEGYDEVVIRGDAAARVFTAFWLRGGEVLAGMHANDWDAIDGVRRVVSARQVDLAALRDPRVPLDHLAG